MRPRYKIFFCKNNFLKSLLINVLWRVLDFNSSMKILVNFNNWKCTEIERLFGYACQNCENFALFMGIWVCERICIMQFQAYIVKCNLVFKNFIIFSFILHLSHLLHSNYLKYLNLNFQLNNLQYKQSLNCTFCIS